MHVMLMLMATSSSQTRKHEAKKHIFNLFGEGWANEKFICRREREKSKIKMHGNRWMGYGLVNVD